MAKAKMAGGLYYIGDKAVNSEGVEIPDAPPKPENTPTHLQTGALGGPTPEQKMGAAIAEGIMKGMEERQQALRSPAPASEETEDAQVRAGKLPTIAELPDVLAKITDVARIEAMAKVDERVTAAPLYEARIAELKAE